MMGALAKMVATFVTYPLQVIQARLRVSIASVLPTHLWWLCVNHYPIQAGHDNRGHGFPGMLHALDQIYM
jgi:hypothetical protein